MTDISVISAVYQATIYGNFEPLISYIERGDPSILKNDIARSIIVKLMRGEKFLGKGNKFSNIKQEKRNREIISFLYTLKGYGIPTTSNKTTGKPVGVEIASKRFHLSSEHIRKEIWQKRGRKKVTWEMAKQLGATLKKEGYKIDDLLPAD